MESKLKILNLEDSQLDSELISGTLEASGLSFEMARVETAEEFVRELEKNTYDLILADYSLPTYDGLSALKLVQASHPETIFIMVSGTIGEEAVVEAMKMGATDYVLKNRLEKLSLAISRAILEKENRVNRMQAEKQLHLHNLRLESIIKILQLSLVNEKEFLDYSLEEAIKLTESNIGYIYFYSEDKNEFVLNTWSKGVMEECYIANPETIYKLDKTGLWGETVRQRKPIILNDFSMENPLRKGYPEGHVKLTRFMSIPVFSNEKIVAVAGVANKAEDYDETDVNQFTLLMNSIWKVVEQFRNEKELQELQAQLNQAQKMESIGRLAGGVAHDYNNMLGVIIGHSQLMKDQINENNPLYESVEEILKAAERSAEITKQLLAFARKQLAAPRLLEVNKSLEELFSMIKRLIGEDITLEWQPGKDIWTVYIDPAQLCQVMVNLAVNARDAIKNVGKITIGTQNCKEIDKFFSISLPAMQGSFVKISVTDTGSGIAKEIQERIFEPFFTTKEVGKGTGLGLSTVYGIVKQNNGFVAIDSEPGRGATFSVYLPKCEVEPEKPTNKTGNAIFSGGIETVFIVEDEPSLLSLATRALSRLGYKVFSASSPNDALSLLKNMAENIDLLITDVIMPGMNGVELAEKVKEHRPSIKVLFMSGYASTIISERGGIENGFNFISKPISPKELAAKVREVLSAV